MWARGAEGIGYTLVVAGDGGASACSGVGREDDTSDDLHDWFSERWEGRRFLYGTLPASADDLAVDGEAVDTVLTTINGRAIRVFATEVGGTGDRDVVVTSDDFLLADTGRPEIPVTISVTPGGAQFSFELVER